MAIDDGTKERLSALMDGALSAEEARFLLRRIEREPELKRLWSSWHRIRAWVGEGGAAPMGEDFADRIMERIDREDAPQPTAVSAGRGWRAVLGVAVAASVAWLALVGVEPQVTEHAPMTASNGSPATRLRWPDGGLPAQTAALGPAAAPGPLVLVRPADLDAELERYLYWHAQAGYGQGGDPVLPLVHGLAWSTPSVASMTPATEVQGTRP